jgi:hypothetical protein
VIYWPFNGCLVTPDTTYGQFAISTSTTTSNQSLRRRCPTHYVQRVSLRICIDPLTFVFCGLSIIYGFITGSKCFFFLFLNIDIDNLIGILCFFGGKNKLLGWLVIGKEKEKKNYKKKQRFLLKLRIRQHWYPLGIIRKKVLNKNPPNDLH